MRRCLHGTVPVLWVSKGTVRLYVNVPGFPSHKNMTFLTMRANILTFAQWGKNMNRYRTAINRPQTERNRTGEEDVKICDCRVWTERDCEEWGSDL